MLKRHKIIPEKYEKWRIFFQISLKVGLWLVLFSIFYILIHFLLSNRFSFDFKNFSDRNKLFDSIDNFHFLIQGFLFLPLFFAILRALWPKTFAQLGDYFFLGVIITFNLHSLSQILLGSCILTLIPHWLSLYFGTNSRYSIYVWNPLNLPQILLLPSYFFQLILGFYLNFVLANLIQKNKEMIKTQV